MASSKSKTDIWMPLYIGDYLSDTAHLTTEQSGAYLHLLMHYWKTGPLPDNDQALAQIAKLTADAWSNAQAVLRPFFTQNGGAKLHQKRMDEELVAWSDKKQKAKEKAKSAADARWKADAPSIPSSNAPSTPQAMLEQCPLPLPSPIKKKHIPRFTKDEVDAIYEAYPKKGEPREAKKAIESALNRIESETPGADLLAVVQQYAQSPQGRDSDRGLLKNPATWFNKGCYLEGPECWKVARKKY